MNISYQGKKTWFQSQAELDAILGPDMYTSCDFVKVSCLFFFLNLIFTFYKREKWHGYCEAENKWYLYSVYHGLPWCGGSVVKNPPANAGDGISPLSGKIPHAVGQLSLSHPCTMTGTTLAFTRQAFVGKVMSLLFSMLSRPVIAFLPRSKHLGDWEKSIYTFLWLTHESFSPNKQKNLTWNKLDHFAFLNNMSQIFFPSLPCSVNHETWSCRDPDKAELTAELAWPSKLTRKPHGRIFLKHHCRISGPLWSIFG